MRITIYSLVQFTLIISLNKTTNKQTKQQQQQQFSTISTILKTWQEPKILPSLLIWCVKNCVLLSHARIRTRPYASICGRTRPYASVRVRTMDRQTIAECPLSSLFSGSNPTYSWLVSPVATRDVLSIGTCFQSLWHQLKPVYQYHTVQAQYMYSTLYYYKYCCNKLIQSSTEDNTTYTNPVFHVRWWWGQRLQQQTVPVVCYNSLSTIQQCSSGLLQQQTVQWPTASANSGQQCSSAILKISERNERKR